VFDDHCCAIEGVKNGVAQFAKPDGPSRGLVLSLDQSKHTATLVHQYTPVRGNTQNAAFLGSMQLLPNGNVLVGWGTSPWITEYTDDGKVLLDAKLPRGGQNYRVLRMPWIGRPAEAPALVARRGAGRTLLYASWNGATEVAFWRVDVGASRSDLMPAETVPRRAFETRIVAPPGRFAQVTALDGARRPLRASATVRL
jgi:hypothetical protein